VVQGGVAAFVPLDDVEALGASWGSARGPVGGGRVDEHWHFAMFDAAVEGEERGDVGGGVGRGAVGHGVLYIWRVYMGWVYIWPSSVRWAPLVAPAVG
jgi:hypothetical protein